MTLHLVHMYLAQCLKQKSCRLSGPIGKLDCHFLFGDFFYILCVSESIDVLCSNVLKSPHCLGCSISAAKRYSSPDAHSEFHSSASQLAANLVNVRSISAHFHPRINAWSASHHVTSITPEQVYTHV